MAKAAARLVFPVPAVPEASTVLPRVYPGFPPQKRLSNDGMPVETFSALPGWSRPAEVMGITERPSLSMTKGYSFVPCLEPRYLITRIRRIAICSFTLLSKKMMQSDTNSSRPLLEYPFSGSPVTMAVTCLSFSQRKSLLISTRRTPGSLIPAKGDSSESKTTRLAPIASMACYKRTSSPSRLKSFS